VPKRKKKNSEGITYYWKANLRYAE
jgi:hypothetical protein